MFVGLSLYLQLHLYVRDPMNIEMTYENFPIFLSVVDYLDSKNISKIIIVTSVNVYKQLDDFKAEPEKYNSSMINLLGKDRTFRLKI